jgi:hypothetical protein
MYTFTGPSPTGPFRPDTEAFRLLGSKPPHFATYFARFYRTPDGLLVNHHSCARPENPDQKVVNCPIALAPLKKAVLDGDGHLRLGWWSGNAALRGRSLRLRLASSVTCSPDGAGVFQVDEGGSCIMLRSGSRGAVAMLGETFDLDSGLVLEGSLKLNPDAADLSQIGFFVEDVAQHGTAVVLGTDGKTEFGPLGLSTEVLFERDDFVATGGYASAAGIPPRKSFSFRLLIRQSFLELYLDDMFVQAYSLPLVATGRLGFLVRCGEGEFGQLKAWRMDL